MEDMPPQEPMQGSKLAEEFRDLLLSRLSSLRDDLLDLSNRNRLLSFKHSDRARTHIRVIDELPDVLFRMLRDGKKLRFKSLPEPESEPEDEKSEIFQLELEAARLTDDEYKNAISSLNPDDVSSDESIKAERELRNRVRENLGLPPWIDEIALSKADFARQKGLEPTYELPFPSEVGEDPEKHLDDEIQTLHYPKEMDRKLGGIADQARTMFQEAGISTLRAAFGFLEWRGSPTSDRIQLSPLLLLPVEMERKKSRPYRKFLLYSDNAEVEMNRTLSIRLEKDFGFDLPEFEDEDTPERYLQKVKEAVANHPQWRVRRFLTIGNFGFSKLAMYNDLDSANWPQDKAIPNHQTVGRILLGAVDPDEQLFAADDYEIDTPEMDRKAPCLVVPADASQHSAILDVLDGKNLVIKGPPGTGKSQTITNIIAANLAAGKRVLFLAEKMAALDVVKSRLDDVGLGEFCLQLHANKGPKIVFLESLRDRLELQNAISPPAALDAQIEELRSLRDQLNKYVTDLNQPIGELGKTVQQVLWAEQRARLTAGNFFEAVRKTDISDPLTITPSKMSAAHQKIDIAFATRDALHGDGGDASGPSWKWVRNSKLDPFDVQETLDMTKQWVTNLRALHEALNDLEPLYGPPKEISLREVSRLTGATNALPDIPNKHVLEIVEASRNSESKKALSELLDVLRNTLRRPLGGIISEKDVFLPSIKHDWEKLGNQFAEASEKLLSITSGIRNSADAICWVNQQKQFSAELGQLSQILETAQKIAGLTTGPNKTQLLKLIIILKLLRSVDREVLLRRNARTTDDSAMTILSRATEVAKVLHQAFDVHSQKFVLKPLPRIDEVSIHAAVLRQAGLLSVLNSDVRQAKKFFRSIAKERKSTSVKQMAEEATELSAHLSELDEFTSDQNLISLCGEWFHGLNTDFESLLNVSRWASKVRHSIPIVDQVAVSLRQMLLEGPVDVLDTLLELAPDEEILDRLERQVSNFSDDSNISETESIIANRAEEMSSAALFLTESFFEVSDDLKAVGYVSTLLKSLEPFRKEIAALRVGEMDSIGHSQSEISIENIAQALEFQTSLDAVELPKSVIEGLCGRKAGAIQETLSGWVTRYGHVSEEEIKNRGQIETQAEINPSPLCGVNDMGAAKIGELISCLEQALESPEALSHWVEFLRSTCETDNKTLNELISTLIETGATNEQAKAAYDRLIFHGLAKAAYKKCPELNDYSGLSIETTRAKFQELDKQILNTQREKLRSDLCHKKIPGGVGYGYKRDFTDLSLIQNELGKKGKHIPLRDMVVRAKGAIQRMKPCFMMSPLSVATFLPPGKFEFDLVVIDEASQMNIADAIGALARASQCVIVGDPMQLPPTSFFKRFEDASEDDEDEEDEGLDSESILDQALSVLRPPRELKWHYRSRHESLIAFSNKQFYNNSLTIFPSPIAKDDKYGVRLVQTNGTYAKSHNPEEAIKIADWAVNFMRTHPHRSLGIATLNQVQRDLILDEMERRFGEDRSAESYRRKWDGTLYPFFVKNLENVQGDERDVIAISVVYGPNADGKVAQNFGPISKKNGERRLNVLFTRAREQVVVFSSLRPEQISLRETTGLGPRALKNYLEYALTGRLDPGAETDRPPDSDFEVAVANQITGLGYKVTSQFGVAGFFLDLAVMHPDFPGVYLVGVECDGATYHSAKSARDRDRLREEVLRGLGWNLFRIWSTDWFQDPQNEIEKLRKHIEAVADERRALSSKPSSFPEPFDLEELLSEEDELSEEPIEIEKPDLLGEKINEPEQIEICVAVGDTVSFHYLDAPENSRTYTLVSGEYDPKEGTISPLSPVGSALMGSAIGDEVDVATQHGAKTLVIDEIQKFESSPMLGDDESKSRNNENQISKPIQEGTNKQSEQNSRTASAYDEMETAGIESRKPNSWAPRPLPDPRTTHKSDVSRHLKEIVEAEGPIRVRHAFRMYAKACRIGRIGREVRSKLNGALYLLIRQHHVEIEEDGASKGQINGTVRISGTPQVIVRGGPGREFWDIPPSEITEVMNIKFRVYGEHDTEGLYRKILNSYGLSRLTNNIREELDRIRQTLVS